MSDLTNDFEKKYSEFLDSAEAEEIFNIYFAAVRKAYIAGYNTALEEKKGSGQVVQIKNFDMHKRTDEMN